MKPSPLIARQQPPTHISEPQESPHPPSSETSLASTPRARTLPPNISIDRLTNSTIPSFRRLLSTLLPIRYPDKFYTEILTSPTISAVSQIATWHDHPLPPLERPPAAAPSFSITGAVVVGGIRCRLEPLPPTSSSTASTPAPLPHQIYIQTLAVLSPYRSLGVATALLDTTIHSALNTFQHLTTKSIYAHVWEANTEALGWYVKRGFVVEDGVVEGYYSRLRPSGARVVRREIRVGDYVGCGKVKGNGER